MMAQNRHTVTGVVTDENANPFPGVAVMVEGTTVGSLTEANGTYTISAAPQETIVFTCIGYKDQRVLVGNLTTLNIQMEPDVNLLDETERVDGLYQELCREGYQDQFKILLYPSEDDPEYSFLKIYNANATAENMIDYLLKETHLNRLITVSDEHSRHGVMYAHHDSNHIVRMIRRSFLYGGEIKK